MTSFRRKKNHDDSIDIHYTIIRVRELDIYGR